VSLTAVRRALAESPSLPLLLIAIACFVWLGADEGGFRGTIFLPATLLLLALLVVGLFALPTPRPSRPALLAIGLFASYALWSYLSILWAEQQDMAWEGANRTAMYAIVFALFALWPLRGRAATTVAVVYVFGVAGVGLVELLKASATDNPIAYLDEGRLAEPTGYVNANVALWSSAFWPAMVLAGRREMPPSLRGALLGSAGLLAALAILGQSRGWVVLVPVVILVAIAVVPGRGRTIAALALVAVMITAISGPLLDVYRQFDARSSGSQGVSQATTAIVVACVPLIAAGLAWSLLDLGPWLSEAARRRLGKAIVVAFGVCCLAGLVGYAATKGDPIARASEAWSDFKKGEQHERFRDARLGSLGGSYRYDYWRVAWDNFEEHPLTGIGVDNFSREYLLHGKSRQTPLYPHSVELGVLSETGLIGALLLVGTISAAVIAAVRRIRRGAGLEAVIAATGIVVFAYFIVHGSVDWFWEFPALGAPAFAMLGIAGAVGLPRADKDTGDRTRLTRRLLAGTGVVAALVLACSLILPWLAERELEAAQAIAAENPSAAIDKLERASDLNPFWNLPAKTAAVIERQLGDAEGAKHRLEAILAGDEHDSFAHLQLAVLASAAGHRAEAVREIRRARELNPRDAVTRRVQKRLEAGERVTPRELDRMIDRDIQQRIGRS
jgi:O-Antigen ligase